jgi:hypothetical protein
MSLQYDQRLYLHLKLGHRQFLAHPSDSLVANHLVSLHDSVVKQ